MFGFPTIGNEDTGSPMGLEMNAILDPQLFIRKRSALTAAAAKLYCTKSSEKLLNPQTDPVLLC